MYNFTQPGPLADPTPPKKSIIDSVLERLYPAGMFGGLLPDNLLHEQRMMALRHAGLSLMAAPASIPGQPPHTFNSDLATALDPQGWQEQLGNTAQSALAIHGAQRKLQDEAVTDAILAKYPRNPNASPQEEEQRLRAVAGELQSHGQWEAAGVASGMIDKMRPEALKEANGYLYDPQTGKLITKLPPKAATIEGSQLWSNAVARLAPWQKIKETVDRYTLYRNAPSTPQSDQALLASANELLTTHGGYPDDKSALEHIPLLGDLYRLVQGLAGKTRLDPAERDDLIATTDRAVDQLGHERDSVRRDVERLMTGTPTSPGFSAPDIQSLLPAAVTWPTFTTSPRRPTRRRSAGPVNWGPNGKGVLKY